LPGLPAGDYEQLTQWIVSAIAAEASVRTVRIDRNIRLQGAATTNQIDVMWTYEDSGREHTVLFECRSYVRALTQQALFAWSGVVRDLQPSLGDCEGVMVTSTGYQSGAQAVADTYGIVILELRKPTENDLDGRLLGINLRFRMRTPFVRDVQVDAVEILGEQTEFRAWGTDVELEYPDGSTELMAETLLRGELTALRDEPTPAHQVVRSYQPPVKLIVEGHPCAVIRAIRATVGEADAEPIRFDAGGRDRLAWMLKDTLNGTRAWFADDGRYHVTD